MKKTIYIILIVLLYSCCSSEKEKYQRNRTNIINCKDKVKKINTEPLILSGLCKVYIVGKYLFILDAKPLEYFYHVFNKNNFNYICSFGTKGQGPKDLTNPGTLAIDEINREFFITDHGKQKILAYNIDSVLVNPKDYTPMEKVIINDTEFPSQYVYLSDTLSIARMLMPTGNYGFNEARVKWNMITGKVTPMKYTHPKIKRKRTTFAFSKKHKIYAECYLHHDLMTIADMDGNLLYNIYGNKWRPLHSNQESHYQDVVFIEDYIVASYSGNKNLTDERFPTKLLVFNIKGDYIKTIDIGYSITDLTYDKDNHRIMFKLNDELEFAYLNLKGII